MVGRRSTEKKIYEEDEKQQQIAMAKGPQGNEQPARETAICRDHKVNE